VDADRRERPREEKEGGRKEGMGGRKTRCVVMSEEGIEHQENNRLKASGRQQRGQGRFRSKKHNEDGRIRAHREESERRRWKEYKKATRRGQQERQTTIMCYEGQY
jgi:hypothetical protein